MRFKDFVRLREISLSVPFGLHIPTAPAGSMSSFWTGSKSADSPSDSNGWFNSNLSKGTADLGLPSVEKTGRVEFIGKKHNPILVYLSDGTRLFMPYDAFRKAGIERGRTVTIVLQRRSDDGSVSPSQIQSIRCF